MVSSNFSSSNSNHWICLALFSKNHDFNCWWLTGCPETLVLNMSKLAWSALASVKERDPLASEVSTLCLSQVELCNFSHLFYWQNFWTGSNTLQAHLHFSEKLDYGYQFHWSKMTNLKRTENYQNQLETWDLSLGISFNIAWL
jgi:hypothetical protein